MLNVNITNNGRKVSSISPDSLAAFYYFLNESGFETQLDHEHHTLELKPGLHEKHITLSPVMHSHLNSFRRNQVEQQILLQIKKYLEHSGAKVTILAEEKPSILADFHLRLAITELVKLQEPVIELSYNAKPNNRKWLSILRNEIRKYGASFQSNETINDLTPYLTIQANHPEIKNETFWNDYGQNYAIMIAMSILARFRSDMPLSLLSYLPLEFLNQPISKTNKSKKTQNELHKENSNQVKKLSLDTSEKIVRETAETFFDYQTILDSEKRKVKLLVTFTIKNTGTTQLTNPLICLKTDPDNEIKISGQIVPPNVAQSMGIMNDSGASGWKYHSNDWHEHLREKGEIWISPIQGLTIQPNTQHSLNNVQISLPSNEKPAKVQIEGFVFFNEQKLEVQSNNQILVSY